MRDPLPSPNEHPGAAGATPAPAPVQAAGHRSGEGSSSVLEHLVQDRARSSDKIAPPRQQQRR